MTHIDKLACKVLLAIAKMNAETMFANLSSLQQKEKEMACIVDFAIFANKKCPCDKFKCIAKQKYKELMDTKNEVIRATDEYHAILCEIDDIKTKLLEC
jgi:multimeric flavodoxin WrbA